MRFVTLSRPDLTDQQSSTSIYHCVLVTQFNAMFNQALTVDVLVAQGL